MLKVNLLNEKCKPYRAHETDSGLDLRVNSVENIELYPFEPELVRTGVAIELEPGYEAQIRPRSSISRRGISISFGTIDNGYRGEIAVVAMNFTLEMQVLEPYERIAQLVVAPVAIPDVEYVKELCGTERGAGGFGSSGTM